jgi:hypothetical protein
MFSILLLPTFPQIHKLYLYFYRDYLTTINRSKLLTVKVYVWLPRKCFGHCSLQVGTDTYVSFYPGEQSSESSDVSTKNKKQNKGNIFGVKFYAPVHAVSDDYDEDCWYLGDEGKWKREADRIIEILDFHEELINKFWIELQTNQVSYQLLGRNCAAVVVEALKIGYDDYVRRIANSNDLTKQIDIVTQLFQYKNLDALRLWHESGQTWLKPWTPETVLKYAQALKRITE